MTDYENRLRWLRKEAGLAPGEAQMGLTAGMEVSGHTAALLAESLFEQRDILVIQAIDHVLGRGDWTLDEVRYRGIFSTLLDGTTLFAFDGQPLLTFWTPKSEIVNDGEKVVLKATQRYRRHYLEVENENPATPTS